MRIRASRMKSARRLPIRLSPPSATTTTAAKQYAKTKKRFDIAPGHRGMIFVPSGVMRAMRVCEDEIVVPYDRLKSFLTDEGAAIVGRI